MNVISALGSVSGMQGLGVSIHVKIEASVEIQKCCDEAECQLSLNNQILNISYSYDGYMKSEGELLPVEEKQMLPLPDKEKKMQLLQVESSQWQSRARVTCNISEEKKI